MSETKQVVTNPSSKVDKNRRRTLLGVAGGAAALGVWHKPVINAVTLPAHAQMSGPTTLSFFSSNVVVNPITMQSPLDWLVSPAVAGIQVQPRITSEYAASISQTAPDTDNYQIDVFERRFEGEQNIGEFLYSGTASEAAGGTLTVTQNPCDEKAREFMVEIVAISDMSITLNLLGPEVSVEIPAGTGSIPTPMCVRPALPNSFFAVDATPLQLIGASSSNPVLLDLLIPEANAGNGPNPDDEFGFSATKVDETRYTVQFLNRRRNEIRSATLSIGQQGNLVWDSSVSCDQSRNTDDIPATITSVDQRFMEISLTFEAGSETFQIPEGTGNLVAICDE